MNKPDKMNNQNLDNLLADFADGLLGEGHVDSLTIQNAELMALQETVMLLKRALVDELPDVAMSARIRGNLAAEWEAQKTQDKIRLSNTTGNWYKKLQKQLNLRSLFAPRTFAFGFAAVALVVLVVVFLINPDIGTEVVGSAIGPAGWLPAAIVLISAGILGLFMYLRSRR